MRKLAPVWVCLTMAFAFAWAIHVNASFLREWLSDPSHRSVVLAMRYLPYVLFAVCALWASNIANTPVFVLSVAFVPAHFYFSGGSVWLGGAEQMRLVLFLLLPVMVTAVSFISHRTLSSSLKTGLIVAALGFLVPPLISVLAGRDILLWFGQARWSGAHWIGAPASPTLFYLFVLGLNLILPFGGREGQMKKILATVIPCFYFSGVFQPIFRNGPLYPRDMEEPAFALFTSLAALITLYSNAYLSWTKAYVDDLTQVLGRRALNESIAHLKGSFSIAMVDVDHFKNFNDTYGHAAGDVVLKEVAAILSEKSGGQVFRYGGEEFSVLYSGMNVDAAHALMDETRRALESTKIHLNGASKNKRDKKVSVQISVGVSESKSGTENAEDVIRSADRALYKAKENGRNRVERL